MKKFLSFLCIYTSIAHGASITNKGPLQVGNFDPYVSQVATNKINQYFLPTATKRNNGTFPTGSVAAMWQEIGKEGVTAYFKSHKDKLKASAAYVERSNDCDAATSFYNLAHNSRWPTDIRAFQWNNYILTAACVFGLLEKETIPKLNLKPISVVGIMKENQDLTFTSEESVSFGGAIAATISVMNLIYKTDPAAFKMIYNTYLPENHEVSITAPHSAGY